MDLVGNVLRTWSQQPAGSSSWTPIPWSLNHELSPLPDGSFLSLIQTSIEVPEYPESYEDPPPVGPARIRDGRVVRFAADGEVLSSWPLSARLDTARIGFNSLTPGPGGYDWVHANVYPPEVAVTRL